MEPSKSVMRPILPDTIEVRKYVFKNGKFYEDELVNKVSFELLNGFKYENGDTYKGVIKNGEFAGEFKAKTRVYIGNFKSWMAEGDGKIEFPNSAWYEGEFKKGALNGRGTLIYLCGNIFEGIIENGKLLCGTHTFCDKTIYEGSFYNHKFEGVGIMLYTNGSRYEGHWERNMRHGWGQMIYRDNGKDVRTYEGFWEDDKECNSKMKCEKLA